MLVPYRRNIFKIHTTKYQSLVGTQEALCTISVKGGNFLNCVCLVEQNDWTNEDWSEKGDISELKHIFSDWHPEIQEILESTKPVVYSSGGCTIGRR